MLMRQPRVFDASDVSVFMQMMIWFHAAYDDVLADGDDAPVPCCS